MKTDKKIEIKMTFIGENSLGYENGKTYNLTINGDRSLLNPKYKDCPIVIEKMGGGGLCPYSGLESFMENWTLPKLINTEVQKAVEEAIETYEKVMEKAIRGFVAKMPEYFDDMSSDEFNAQAKATAVQTVMLAMESYLNDLDNLTVKDKQGTKLNGGGK